MPRDPDHRCSLDPRSTSQLIELLLANTEDDEEDEEARTAAAVLHYRGGLEEFTQAARLARGESAKERGTAAFILGQLGWSDQTFHEESMAILLELLRDESEDVVVDAAYGLGHRNDPRAIPPLILLARHPDKEVRRAVVTGLSAHDDLEAVNTLIELTRDPDCDVRDWATFGIGSQTEMDTPEIRQALLERTEDEEAEIRGEALIGLAARHDPRALPLVRRELEGPFHGSWAVKAAQLLGDASLHPALEALQERLEGEDRDFFQRDFSDALEACRPSSKDGN